MQYMMKRVGSIILCLALLAGSPVNLMAEEAKGAAGPAQAIDELVQSTVKAHKIPGLGLGVILPDGTKIERSYGMANLEDKTSLEKDSVFEIGSVSKTFTAIGILMLAEEGRLSIEDPITKYFPEYPQWHAITLKHLLQHTSGITELVELEEFKNEQEKDWTPQETIALESRKPLDFEPGQAIKYSNIGCIILGLVIEKVTGVPYGDFLRDRITKPLGMNDTRFTKNKILLPKRVAGYALSREGEIQNAKYASVYTPFASGGITSTASDLLKLREAFTPGVLLKAESIEAMFAPARLNNGEIGVTRAGKADMAFGYSLDMIKRGDDFVPGKTGGISGFNSFFFYFKDSKALIALTSNLDESLGVLVELAVKIAGLIGEPFPEPAAE